MPLARSTLPLRASSSCCAERASARAAVIGWLISCASADAIPLTMLRRAARVASISASLSRASARRAAWLARSRSLTTPPTSSPVMVSTSMTIWNSVKVVAS